MGSVIDFPSGEPSTKPEPHFPGPDQVLKRALMRDLAEVTVIGMTPSGMSYYSSTLTDAGHLVLTIEEFKALL